MKTKKKAIAKKKPTTKKKVVTKNEINWYDKKEYKYLVDAVERVGGKKTLDKVKGYDEVAIEQAIEMTVEIEYHELNKKDLMATWGHSKYIVETFLDNLFDDYEI